MRKLRWGAYLCGLGLALAGWTQPLPAHADTPVPAPPATAPSAPTPAEPSPTTTAPPTPAPGASSSTGGATYIVRFRNEAGPADGTAADATLADRTQRELDAIPGVIARLTSAQARDLALDPAVAYVQKDAPVHVADTQTQPPWGLDRIDESGLPLDSRYTYARTGAGVKVYVVDTGIDADHPEFGGRVAAGASFVPDGSGTGDCYGHGTHVAGTIGGTTFGVAKQVTLVPVRVLDCSGNGTSAATVAALDWIAKDHRTGQKAVVNLSLTGSYSRAENDMVARLVAEGVTVVAAAGNDSMDACEASPGSAPAALTVAATDAADQRAGFSNDGPCVDLYAPGVDIRSASPFGAPVLMSGTSMASPHVAGVAAMLVGAHPTWTPAKVAARILRLSLTSRVGGKPAGTPNLLLNIAPSIHAVSPATASTAGGQVVTLSGRRFDGVTAALFDGVPGTGLKISADHNSLTVTTPAHAEGTARLVLASELSNSNRDVTLAFLPPAVVTSVSPGAGPVGGGTPVTLRGSRFTGATAVTFGGTPAASFTVVSDAEVHAVSPPGSSGTVDVRVTTAAGPSAPRSADHFAYGKVPTVSAVSPSTGLTIGGARVTITGRHFSSGTTVLFGTVPGTAVSVSSSKRLSVTAPALPAGPASLRVVNRYGPSTGVAFTATVAPAPRISALSPAKGFAAGGAKVTITGSNFHGVTAVTFGRTAATIVSASSTKLVVRAPAQAAGAVGVTVTGAYGTATGGTYTYAPTPAPVVSGVSPAKGSRKGGTVVTLTGKYFYGVTAVTFGGVPGTRLSVTSSTRLKVTTPAHATGKVAIGVRAGAGLVSAASSTARFTYA